MHSIRYTVSVLLAAHAVGQAPAAAAPPQHVLPAAPPPAAVAFDGKLTCVLQVRNLDAAIAWYQANLGLKLAWKNDQIGFAEVQTAGGDVMLGLARHESPSVEPGVVLTFGVLDVAAAKTALEAKAVTTEPIVTYPGLVKLLVFKDGDGNTLQLFESLQQPPPAHAGLEAVAFLAGSWVRQEGDDREEEHWTSPDGGMMVGMARTVKGGKATFFESLRIEKTKEGIVYIAAPAGQPPTPFTFEPSKSGKDKAVFENPKNDFPQRIVYWLAADGRLHARIESEKDGKTRGRDFVWSRGSLR